MARNTVKKNQNTYKNLSVQSMPPNEHEHTPQGSRKRGQWQEQIVHTRTAVPFFKSKKTCSPSHKIREM